MSNNKKKSIEKEQEMVFLEDFVMVSRESDFGVKILRSPFTNHILRFNSVHIKENEEKTRAEIEFSYDVHCENELKEYEGDQKLLLNDMAFQILLFLLSKGLNEKKMKILDTTEQKEVETNE